MRAAVVLAAAALAALPGCGGSDKAAPALSRPQEQGLLKRIDTIRAAAVAGDLATTESRLRGFAREVGRLRRGGALSSQTAQALLTGASRAAARAQVEVVPPPAPPSLPPGQAKKQHQRKPGKPGKGPKKEHGHGGGD